MRIVSILENQNIEKRIALTLDSAKKYIEVGFNLSIPENYGKHLGINDEEFKQASEDAKNDFVAAMKVASEEFKVQKDLLGVDGAVDLFRSQWEVEDRLSREANDQDIVGEFE